MKIQVGEVFAIQTKIGFGFLQYIKPDQFGVEIIRVLEPIKKSNEISQQEVDMPERYTVHFVVNAALRRKLIYRTGLFKIPEGYRIPENGREKHTVRGKFLGWHITDLKTLKIETKNELTQDDLKLPPAGHPNDTLIKDWLENNWRLDHWR